MSGFKTSGPKTSGPKTADLLLEIGTEELPPASLRQLAGGLAAETEAGLRQWDLSYGDCRWYATPRRLAVLVAGVACERPGTETLRRGPSLAAAYDKKRRFTAAASGFARACGVAPEALEIDQQAQRLVFRSREAAQPAAELLPALVREALARLPLARPMRWGAGQAEFARPVRWVTLLFGETALAAEVFGLRAGRCSYGHRFHHPGAIELPRASDYARLLAEPGRVCADYRARRERIRELLAAAVAELGGRADMLSEALLEEVTSLVEWPTVLAGRFPERYLELPEELLVSVMQEQQRFFPVFRPRGGLMPAFLSVLNIAPADTAPIRRGNEKVIVPRFRDAEFFWRRDRARPLSDYRERLRGLVFHEKLGAMSDKSARLADLAGWMAETLGAPAAPARRAGELCKCDLLSELVGEFPKLQGIAGGYYARRGGEPPEVARAIGEQYRPGFAGDAIPATPLGRILALADRLDSIAGIFGIGQAPTGEKDPYALRRAALGAMRILIEGELALGLRPAIRRALAAYGTALAAAGDREDAVFAFMMERLRAWYQEAGVKPQVFEAVRAAGEFAPLDFHRRILAVRAFRELPEAARLAAAHKRIHNILRKSAAARDAPQGDAPQKDAPQKDALKGDMPLRQELLQQEAERDLARDYRELQQQLRPVLQAGDYEQALRRLAGLQDAVDRFFDQVTVMDENPELQRNRLALLQGLHRLFNGVADLSRL